MGWRGANILIPYQNVLWLSNAVLQASIVILTVVAAFVIFFLRFTWSHLQEAKALEHKELDALNKGKSLAGRLIQAYRPEIARVYESWFDEKPEDIEKVTPELSLHPVISRTNARQRLLLFLVGPQFLARLLEVCAVPLGLVFLFTLLAARKRGYLRVLWITFCMLTGMPVFALRPDKPSFPLISPVLFSLILFTSSPVVKAFKDCGISEFKIRKLGSIEFKGPSKKIGMLLRLEIVQWAILHELSKWFPSELIFPLQLDFMDRPKLDVAELSLSRAPSPVGFYPTIERNLFDKAKETNMPAKFRHQLLELIKKQSHADKKDVEASAAQIAEYRLQISRLSTFVKRPGRIFLKGSVGLLVLLCGAAAILSLFAISGASSADLVSKNLVQIAMAFLIFAIMTLGIAVALLLKSF